MKSTSAALMSTHATFPESSSGNVCLPDQCLMDNNLTGGLRNDVSSLFRANEPLEPFWEAAEEHRSRQGLAPRRCAPGQQIVVDVRREADDPGTGGDGQ